MQSNYDFFMKTDVSPYLGEWIAIHDEKIIAHDKNIKKVFADAKSAAPGCRPFIARVPSGDVEIYQFSEAGELA